MNIFFNACNTLQTNKYLEKLFVLFFLTVEIVYIDTSVNFNFFLIFYLVYLCFYLKNSQMIFFYRMIYKIRYCAIS